DHSSVEAVAMLANHCRKIVLAAAAMHRPGSTPRRWIRHGGELSPVIVVDVDFEGIFKFRRTKLADEKPRLLLIYQHDQVWLILVQRPEKRGNRRLAVKRLILEAQRQFDGALKRRAGEEDQTLALRLIMLEV